MHANVDGAEALDMVAAWRFLLQVRKDIDAGTKPVKTTSFRLSAEARELFDLFLPLALTSRDQGCVTAVLGQTLDGYIATHDGDSRYVNEQAGLTHLHRIRALSDAILIGVNTAALDNPRLTTRAVEGPNAARAVIDPNGRLPASSLLLNDGAAPTFILHAGNSVARDEQSSEQNRFISLPHSSDGGIAPSCIVAALRARGLTRILVEGGSDTVSRFLAAGQLDHLQLIVASCLLGGGKPALCLPLAKRMNEAMRPTCRPYVLGSDVVFDLVPASK